MSGAWGGSGGCVSKGLCVGVVGGDARKNLLRVRSVIVLYNFELNGDRINVKGL